MKFLGTLLVFFILASFGHAHAREQILVVGSSTVYPFATLAAEQFGQGGLFKTPIIESTGTGGGMKLFCEGVGVDTPDIANASRKITDSEKELCEKNGVKDIVEIPIGYDGIVIVGKKGTELLNLSKKDIFLALARELPNKKGVMVANPYRRWKEINPALPDRPIMLYGQPPTSGTRDAFSELVLEKGCEDSGALNAVFPDEKQRKKMCHLIREDGAFIEAGESGNIVVQKLVSNEKALGILGYSFYDENKTKIQAHRIEGLLPDDETIESGAYSVSRGLYVYVKKQHIGVVPGIAEFIQELTGENAVGIDGYITAKGLLPLRESERSKMHALVKLLK